MQTGTSDYARVKEAIHFIRDNAAAQPTLEDVADYLGLSRFHSQRLFRRWAGITPKRFLQCLTVEHAKTLLRESASVLEATWDTGLSSPGRLHDLFVSTEAVTPGEFKTGGQQVTVRYGLHETPFGRCLLAATERGICALDFLDGGADDNGGGDNDCGEIRAVDRLRSDWPAARLVEDPAQTAPLVAAAFEAVRKGGARPPLHVRGTNFQIRVWQALLRIPAGAAVPYGRLAASVEGGGPRSVGQALGANRVAGLIPCHRVLRATGALGGYRWGAERKVALLAWESSTRY